MTLNVQIKTIIFSFLIGLTAYFLRILFYRKIYHKNKIIRFVSSFIYIEFLFFIYIKCSYIINNLCIHFYSIFFLIFGYLMAFFYSKNIV